MSPVSGKRCDQTERVPEYVLHALPASEVPVVEAHISVCAECRQEMEMLRPIVDFFISWPTDVLFPSPSLWGRLVGRIAAETGEEPVVPTTRQWSEQEWAEMAPGVSCKLLATDTERGRVSMLVRLAPGTHYPAHTHAGVEELYLLHGELWLNDRKLCPGDYNRSEPPSVDEGVWSETGCTCVLIASLADILRPQFVTAVQ